MSDENENTPEPQAPEAQTPEAQTVRVPGIPSEEGTGSPGGGATTDAERIYDEQIRPLADQVYDLCMKHEIPYTMAIDLGNGTTASSACHWYEAEQHSPTYLVGALLQAIRMQDDVDEEVSE